MLIYTKENANLPHHPLYSMVGTFFKQTISRIHTKSLQCQAEGFPTSKPRLWLVGFPEWILTGALPRISDAVSSLSFNVSTCQGGMHSTGAENRKWCKGEEKGKGEGEGKGEGKGGEGEGDGDGIESSYPC